jgi:hypothetical protein
MGEKIGALTKQKLIAEKRRPRFVQLCVAQEKFSIVTDLKP